LCHFPTNLFYFTKIVFWLFYFMTCIMLPTVHCKGPKWTKMTGLILLVQSFYSSEMAPADHLRDE
jgi:hypothetical protein